MLKTVPLKLTLSAIFLASLAACGGDSSITATGIPVGSVVVADPYAVCTSVTVGGKAATLERLNGVPFYRPAAGSSGAVVATGCVDETTGVKLSDMTSSGVSLVGGGKEVVSPVTTLLEQVKAQGKTEAEAKTIVANFLKVPEADLNKDPVGDKTVFAATAKLTSTLELIKATGADIASTLANIAKEISKPAASTNDLDTQLASATFLKAITADAAGAQTISDDKLNLVAAVAKIVVDKIEVAATTSTTTPTEISAVLNQIATVVADTSKDVAVSVKAVIDAAVLADTPVSTTASDAEVLKTQTAVDDAVANPTITQPAVVAPPTVNVVVTGAIG